MPDASRESNSTDSKNLTSPLENLSKLSRFKMQGKIRLQLKSQFEAADLPNPGRVVTSAKKMQNVFGLRLTQGAVRGFNKPKTFQGVKEKWPVHAVVGIYFEAGLGSTRGRKFRTSSLAKRMLSVILRPLMNADWLPEMISGMTTCKRRVRIEDRNDILFRNIAYPMLGAQVWFSSVSSFMKKHGISSDRELSSLHQSIGGGITTCERLCEFMATGIARISSRTAGAVEVEPAGSGIKAQEGYSDWWPGSIMTSPELTADSNSKPGSSNQTFLKEIRHREEGAEFTPSKIQFLSSFAFCDSRLECVWLAGLKAISSVFDVMDHSKHQ
ncbi:hypothetical protein Cni_G13164 [Canna indica]|uniref:Uncharacterized protein n=1 Tax=Canna indica TaxID=4628 RepID=A0AAQ3K933_9LILI|nr:hypothetical protein Cni_G13164 [Canna indica]